MGCGLLSIQSLLSRLDAYPIRLYYYSWQTNDPIEMHIRMNRICTFVFYYFLPSYSYKYKYGQVWWFLTFFKTITVVDFAVGSKFVSQIPSTLQNPQTHKKSKNTFEIDRVIFCRSQNRIPLKKSQIHILRRTFKSNYPEKTRGKALFKTLTQ